MQCTCARPPARAALAQRKPTGHATPRLQPQVIEYAQLAADAPNVKEVPAAVPQAGGQPLPLWEDGAFLAEERMQLGKSLELWSMLCGTCLATVGIGLSQPYVNAGGDSWPSWLRGLLLPLLFGLLGQLLGMGLGVGIGIWRWKCGITQSACVRVGGGCLGAVATGIIMCEPAAPAAPAHTHRRGTAVGSGTYG
jgi:hypothetical protein